MSEASNVSNVLMMRHTGDIPEKWQKVSELAQHVVQLTVPAEGSVETPCVVCGRNGWLGPRQQAVLAAIPESQPMCFWCCLDLSIAAGGLPDIQDLGGD